MASFSVSVTPNRFSRHSTHPPISQRLVRFLAKDGRTYYGDAILPHGVTDISKAKQAKIIQGQIFGKYHVTDQVEDIRLLLAPLALDDVKTVRCLGLNYEQHAKEVTFLFLPQEMIY
jgi:2-keto-4-pentenoate hydratase/2-oxohepta-3-ene-1,7-dioic acid hydratase in catechol pathway